MITAFALALSLCAVDGDQDALNAARDLYASAAYEDALAVLNRVSETSRPADEARAVSQYRAFCLLALGRTAEAERAIETMITRHPTYQPPTTHPCARLVSPRAGETGGSRARDRNDDHPRPDLSTTHQRHVAAGPLGLRRGAAADHAGHHPADV